jgi:hypothetical protein
LIIAFLRKDNVLCGRNLVFYKNDSRLTGG